MEDKVVLSAAEAFADIPHGASVAIAGFGNSHRFPSTLLKASRDPGAKNLTVYCNGLGSQGTSTAQLLVENEQISTLVASLSSRPGPPTLAEEQILAGTLDFEVVPHWILVERMRAGGAGTRVAQGKDVRHFDGRTYILERGITTYFAILRGYRADRYGNVQFRGGSRNSKNSFAEAARTAIIEVKEILEVGQLRPEEIHLPEVIVTRVVKTTTAVNVSSLPQRSSRPAGSHQECNGKPPLSRAEISRRAAAILDTSSVINLGAGPPNQVVNYLDGRDVVFHSENGMLNCGGFVDIDRVDPDFHDAGGNSIDVLPGVSFFDSVASFEIARGKDLDAVALGAYQVGSNGDHQGRPGGAMDLAVGGKSVIVSTDHVDSKGRPKLVQECSYPIAAAECTTQVITDLALRRHNDQGRFTLEEIAAGFPVEENLKLTTVDINTTENTDVMQEA
ncbi:3-oxoacid CoA-transferase subunit A [Nesterenkonia haasae]|uniref:3-oxoacid CoA-transferase subunit A n=1 Tax=Nesterenkonia haasae TaxID=2587813 RepID=UPI001390B182|nr:3-oxoacid CoA-transferase subunit A [Nesterenkonia haasae]NDK32564.1 3-oxoacid CoA-transferase subunit A [Nesterenkonia haasae]